MLDKDQIKEWVEEFLEGSDRFVVDVIIKNNDVIMVFLDADTSLTIDHCVEVSKMIESKLDRDELDYELRVSSAGVDHPLTVKRQYPKNINRNLQIQLKDGTELLGKLIEANDESIIIQPVTEIKRKKLTQQLIGEATSIVLDSIREAKVVVSFQ